MFLKVRHDAEASSLVEVLEVKQLFNPFDTRVQGRLHGGEALPRCWIDSHYQSG